MKRRLNLLAGATAMVMSMATADAAITYDSALVHYTFDNLSGANANVLVDSGSAGINLTASADPSLGTGSFALVPGVRGNALNLIDADGAVNSDGGGVARTSTVNADNALNTSRDTDFSFSTWAKLSGVGNGFFLASKQLSSGNFTGWVVQVQRNGTIQVIFRANNSSDGSGRIIVVSDSSIADTAWHNIGFSFDYNEADATRGVRLYLDGTPLAATATSTGLAGTADINLGTTNNRFTLSGRNSSQVDEGGTLDDLAIWNQILAPSDFAAIVTSVPEPGMVSLVLPAAAWLVRRRR